MGAVSDEPLVLKVLNKMKEKLKFLCEKNRFLTSELRRRLCNALIQSYFHYVCPTWYPNLTKKVKKKLQIMQNKCIRFSLQQNKMLQMAEFRLINWLINIKTVDQVIHTMTI